MIPHTKDEYAPTKEDVRLNALKEEMLKEFDELLTSSMINQLSWEKMKESEVLHDMAEKSHSRIKSFLSSAIDKAYATGREMSGVDVGMLRQWLNEDRITDHTKMVSNEDLMHFIKAARTNNLTDTP